MELRRFSVNGPATWRAVPASSLPLRLLSRTFCPPVCLYLGDLCALDKLFDLLNPAHKTLVLLSLRVRLVGWSAQDGGDLREGDTDLLCDLTQTAAGCVKLANLTSLDRCPAGYPATSSPGPSGPALHLDLSLKQAPVLKVLCVFPDPLAVGMISLKEEVVLCRPAFIIVGAPLLPFVALLLKAFDALFLPPVAFDDPLLKAGILVVEPSYGFLMPSALGAVAALRPCKACFEALILGAKLLDVLGSVFRENPENMGGNRLNVGTHGLPPAFPRESMLLCMINPAGL